VKTYRNLYPQVSAFENIYRAYRKARKGKRKFASVAAFELNQEGEFQQQYRFPRCRRPRFWNFGSEVRARLTRSPRIRKWRSQSPAV
jgi:hypothetical protein